MFQDEVSLHSLGTFSSSRMIIRVSFLRHTDWWRRNRKSSWKQILNSGEAKPNYIDYNQSFVLIDNKNFLAFHYDQGENVDKFYQSLSLLMQAKLLGNFTIDSISYKCYSTFLLVATIIAIVFHPLRQNFLLNFIAKL